MRKTENPGDNLESSSKEIEIILKSQSARQGLERRLRESTNPYHNKQHTENVVQATRTLLDNLADPDLFSDTERLLLVECAWRHDDGHVGRTYRQEVANDGLSNEEHAVALLKQDLRGRLGEKNLKLMEDAILVTSFGQNDASKLPESKQRYLRPYKPKTDLQRLLALADVNGFTRGWNEWADESFRVLEESPRNELFDIDAWLIRREGFVNFYISPLIDSVGPLLKPEYFKQLQQGLGLLRRELAALRDKSNPKRTEYANRLKTIKEAVVLPEDR